MQAGFARLDDRLDRLDGRPAGPRRPPERRRGGLRQGRPASRDARACHPPLPRRRTTMNQRRRLGYGEVPCAWGRPRPRLAEARPAGRRPGPRGPGPWARRSPGPRRTRRRRVRRAGLDAVQRRVRICRSRGGMWHDALGGSDVPMCARCRVRRRVLGLRDLRCKVLPEPTDDKGMPGRSHRAGRGALCDAAAPAGSRGGSAPSRSPGPRGRARACRRPA